MAKTAEELNTLIASSDLTPVKIGMLMQTANAIAQLGGFGTEEDLKQARTFDYGEILIEAVEFYVERKKHAN